MDNLWFVVKIEDEKYSIPVFSKTKEDAQKEMRSMASKLIEKLYPKKGDKITITRYGETFKLTFDNADPSQLGGVSIYATRNSW